MFVFVLASAVAQVGSPLFGGIGPESTGLLVSGMVSAVVAFLLARKRRWLAWLAFYFTLIASCVALGRMLGITDVPSWLYGSIVSANWLAAAMLFVYLWKPDPGPA